MAKNLINGKCYDWNDISIDVDGMENIEVTSISYGDKQEHEGVYGKGGRYRGYGTGNTTNQVSIEMLREDFDEYCCILKKKGYNNFYDYVIPKITVSYANTGEKTSTDVLTKVKLGSRDTNPKQGEKSVTFKTDGVAYGGIKWNGMN